MTSAEKPGGEPLLAGVRAQLDGLLDELRGMLAARWQLARLELADARTQLVRLAVALSLSLCAGSMAGPVLVVASADALEGAWGWPRWAWLLAFGLSLLLLAVASACLGWRHFRRRFVGMTESLEELREDLVWVREHFQTPESRDE